MDELSAQGLRGLTAKEVELEHLRAVIAETQRERHILESVQKDNATLTDQLRRSEELRTKQEAHIAALESVRIEQ